MNKAPACTLPLDAHEPALADLHRGVREVLGTAAWQRLPEAVRERFGNPAEAAEFAGGFEVVRASALGRVFGWLGCWLGTPVVPRVGVHVGARVHVRPGVVGSVWIREYLWPDGSRDRVQSTKVVDDDLRMTERLPARLCMPLTVYEEHGTLNFTSHGYYFDLGGGLRLSVPSWLTPGVTHVEHIDLGHGWFRFTLTVTHPLFGETFFQTGRFCASEEFA